MKNSSKRKEMVEEMVIKEEKRLPGIKHRRDRKEASCSCVWNQLFPQIPSMEVHVSVHRTGPSSSGLPCPIEFNLGLFQIASYSACLHTDRASWGSEAYPGQCGLLGAALRGMAVTSWLPPATSKCLRSSATATWGLQGPPNPILMNHKHP